MKKAFIFILLFTCISIFAVSENNKEYFEFVNEYPTIDIQIAEQDFVFLLDSGSNKSFLSNKMIKKLGIEDLINKKATQNILEEFDESKAYFYIKLSDFQIGPENIKEIKLFSEKEKSSFFEKYSDIDGILGLDVLHEFSNLIIDYKNKRIYFNTTEKIENTVNSSSKKFSKEEVDKFSQEMKAVYEIYKDNPSVKNVTYGYKPSIPTVSAFIDSEEKNAIICTGFLEKNSVIFVDENQTKSSVNKKIKIGTKTFKKTTFDLLENNFLDNESLIETINNTNNSILLGHGFLKNKIIQFDFKNGIFAIIP